METLPESLLEGRAEILQMFGRHFGRIKNFLLKFSDLTYILGFPLSRDFSNFQVPGLSGSLGPVLPGPRDLQGL